MVKGLALNARHLILVHNHPNGSSKPSYEDVEMTQYLVNVGNLLRISVLDHIIIGSDTDFSFRQNGLLSSSAG